MLHILQKHFVNLQFSRQYQRSNDNDNDFEVIRW